MKRINTCLFVTLMLIVGLFIGLILVRDAMNRHHYDHFEQATLEKTRQLDSLVGHQARQITWMSVRMDSLRSQYKEDSTRWAQRALLNHRRLEQTRKQLDESVQKQKVTVPKLRRSDFGQNDSL